MDAGTVPAVSTKKRDVTCARAQARKAPVPDRRLEGDRLTVAGETGLRFYLERDLPSELDIYDVAGYRVARLAEGTQAAGWRQVTRRGRDQAARTVHAGVYFARLHAAGTTVTRNLVTLH